MNKHATPRSPAQADADAVGPVFAALADPTRRAILDHLARAPAGPTALAKLVGVSQPAVTKHLNVLHRARLVERRIHGRNHWCLLRAEALADASAWLDRYRDFWQGQLEALSAMFDAISADTPTSSTPTTPAPTATRPTRPRAPRASTPTRKPTKHPNSPPPRSHS